MAESTAYATVTEQSTQQASFITRGHGGNTIEVPLKNQITVFTIASYPTFPFMLHDFCAAFTVHFVKFREHLVLHPFPNKNRQLAY
jgi:hypothetical protein